jgi:hypothetical protein
MKREVFYYDAPITGNKGIHMYGDMLYNTCGVLVGSLQVTAFNQNSEQTPINANIMTNKGCIVYTYVREGRRPIITRALYSSGKYRDAIVKRKYISETKRQITVYYK